MIDREAVTWGYRLFLDREPESATIVSGKALRHDSTAQLRNAFVNSLEFKRKNPAIVVNRISGFEKPMKVARVQEERDLNALFERVQAVWTHLGETEPHWSVLSAKEYQQQQIGSGIDKFYNSGKPEVTRIFRTLERNEIDSSRLKTCMEYGCGLGRVTRWLADEFSVVHGIDISKAHLAHADDYFKRLGMENVKLHHLQNVRDIEAIPKVDLIYSRIVLQHNPPPIMSFIITSFMRCLKPGGVAFFQLPVHAAGYEFDLAKYLKSKVEKNRFEMHALPQRRVCEIIATEGGRLLEVFEENSCVRFGVSCFFLVQKPND